MTPRLKKFLIVLLCVIILACTLLPVVQYEISQHYHPLNDTRTVSHSLSILDGMFNHGFNGYLILICPLLSIIAVCVPVPRQHRKWLTCTIIGLSLATYIVLAFVFMDEAFHFSFRDNIEVDYTLLSTSIGIGVFLTTIAYVMCIVITLLPERANANPETQQTVSTTNSSCLTCGAELTLDGRCPACYERMATLELLQQTRHPQAQHQNSLASDDTIKNQKTEQVQRNRQNSLGSDPS